MIVMNIICFLYIILPSAITFLHCKKSNKNAISYAPRHVIIIYAFHVGSNKRPRTKGWGVIIILVFAVFLVSTAFGEIFFGSCPKSTLRA